MKRFGLIVLFVAVFVISLAASIPLDFALARTGLTQRGVAYEHASGTVWSGEVNGVLIAGQPLGDITFRMNPAGLLGGALAFDLNVNGPAGAGQAKARLGFDRSIALSDTVADVDVQALTRLDPRLRQAPAKLTTTIRSLRISPSGQCRDASGVIGTDILTALGGRYAWDGPELAGPISCEGEALRIDLENQGGEDAIKAAARLSPGGIYAVDAEVTTRNIGVEQTLRTLEFTREGGAYVYQRTNAPGAATEEAGQP